MTTIKEIFITYGPEYIQRFGDAMPTEHRKVIEAIINCRTDHYGATIYRCSQCDKNHVLYRCCGSGLNEIQACTAFTKCRGFHAVCSTHLL